MRTGRAKVSDSFRAYDLRLPRMCPREKYLDARVVMHTLPLGTSGLSAQTIVLRSQEPDTTQM